MLNWTEQTVARETADDPRYQRVRLQLVEALLSLAAERPAESISVSELTSAAGVSRAAFYGHATSPASLLAEILIEELRPGFEAVAVRMQQPGADYIELWRQVYLNLLEHVAEHQGVYQVLTSRESAVSSALTSFFERTASVYVNAIEVQLVGFRDAELWRAMAITQQAHNMISVARAWIQTGMAASPNTVVDTYLTLAPPWQLARADADGRISLRRSRSLGRSEHSE